MKKTISCLLFASILSPNLAKAVPDENNDSNHPRSLRGKTEEVVETNLIPNDDALESVKLIARTIKDNPSYDKSELKKMASNSKTKFIAFKVMELLLRENNEWMKNNFSDFIFKPVIGWSLHKKYEMGIGGFLLQKVHFGNELFECEDFILKTIEQLTDVKNVSQRGLVKEILATHAFRSLNAEIQNEANEKTRRIGMLVINLLQSSEEDKKNLGQETVELTYSYLTVISTHRELLSRAIKGLEQTNSITPEEAAFPNLFLS